MAISAVLITKNEAERITDCLKSLDFCEEVIVVDSGSNDTTQDLAQKHGARVLERRFDNFATQKNYAIEQAREQWVLSIDADERVSDELKTEIRTRLLGSDTDSEIQAYGIPRENFIFGKHLRFGGAKNDKPH